MLSRRRAHHIETSPLICCAFYTRVIYVMEELNKAEKIWTDCSAKIERGRVLNFPVLHYCVKKSVQSTIFVHGRRTIMKRKVLNNLCVKYSTIHVFPDPHFPIYWQNRRFALYGKAGVRQKAFSGIFYAVNFLIFFLGGGGIQIFTNLCVDWFLIGRICFSWQI